MGACVGKADGFLARIGSHLGLCAAFSGAVVRAIEGFRFRLGLHLGCHSRPLLPFAAIAIVPSARMPSGPRAGNGATAPPHTNP